MRLRLKLNQPPKAGRPLLAAVTVAGLLSLLASAQIKKVDLDIDPSFASHGLLFVDQSANGFQSALRSLSGDYYSQITPVTPYTLILYSTAKSPVALAVMRYPRKDSAGYAVEGVITNHIIEPVRGQPIVLNPDQATTSVLNNHGKLPVPAAQALAQFMQSTLQNFDPNRFSAVTLSPDLVMFADGGYVGPNRAGMLEVETAKLEYDANLLAQLRDQTISDSDLITQLTAISKQQPGVSTNHHPNYLRDYAISRSGIILRVIEGKREQGSGCCLARQDSSQCQATAGNSAPPQLAQGETNR